MTSLAKKQKNVFALYDNCFHPWPLLGANTPEGHKQNAGMNPLATIKGQSPNYQTTRSSFLNLDLVFLTSV